MRTAQESTGFYAPIIHASHGVAAKASSDLFIHRNLLSIERFCDYLRALRRPYVSLPAALRNEGPALTLDDSTVAAADAALLARRYGHQVSLFVNAFNIERNCPYFFSRLNVALDTATVRRVNYGGGIYELKDLEGKRRFRRRIKSDLAALSTETQRQDYVTEVVRILGLNAISVPRHLAPISVDEVKGLLREGVDIQNHGWSHIQAGTLSPSLQAEDIRRGRYWLMKTFGIEAEFFAVPNGDGLPSTSAAGNYKAWFLLDDKRPPGRIGPDLYNRSNLSI